MKELQIGNVLAFSPDGKLLATANSPVYEPEDTFRKSTIGLWSLSGEELGQLEGNDHYIYDLQISSDGKYLAAIDLPYREESGTLRLWDISG